MCSSSLSFCFAASKLPIPIPSHGFSCRERKCKSTVKASAFSYQKFVNFAVDETKSRAHLTPSSLQENFSSISGADGKTELKFLSFEAPKIRLLRSMCIDGNETMQVLDFAVFPKVEYDLPIFCANFFTSSAMNIILLDLNPLHDIISNRDYREKYYKSLMPLSLKYEKLLPWGGKLTSESLRFFSPIVIWTKFSSSQSKHEALFAVFKDYYQAWLELMERATKQLDVSQIMSNCEAQHRYLTWRAEKDPGHLILEKLIGEHGAKDLLRNFLFKGVDELGRKTFLDYFPEYRLDDGTINEKRSIIGKSFEKRPWNNQGEFMGDNI
ncbi:Phytochromobilin ferredoxin oxidoreductase [Ancistrocladus abbreviatus]